MIINCKDLPSSQVYEYFTKTLIPKPIAWVLTDNGNESYYLESFTYFNAVSNHPPLIFISIEDNSDGIKNLTLKNIEERNDFIVHIPSTEFSKEIQKPETISLNQINHKKLKLDFFAPSITHLPRIKNTKIVFICQKFQIIEIGDVPNSLILGLVKYVYVDDNCIKRNKKNQSEIDPRKVMPLYSIGETSLGIFSKIQQKRN